MKKIFIVFAVCSILFFLVSSYASSGTFDRLLYTFDPSANRAFTYGTYYLNTRDAELYSIDKARYFLNQALRKNPRHSLVHHELSRVFFLRGDFDAAFEHIESQLRFHREATPSAFYMRGLIEGYRGNYEESIRDFREYLKYDSTNWAATNDLAWVLIQNGQSTEAIEVIDTVLPLWERNPWLLNTKASALVELGEYKEAFAHAQKALWVVERMSPLDWLTAYPGNDPKIAIHGTYALSDAISENLKLITALVATSK